MAKLAAGGAVRNMAEPTFEVGVIVDVNVKDEPSFKTWGDDNRESIDIDREDDHFITVLNGHKRSKPDNSSQFPDTLLK